MHSLEALGINDGTAEATGAGQGGGLRLAVCTHRLGHCTSRVALMSGGKSNMQHGLVRSEGHNLMQRIPLTNPAWE